MANEKVIPARFVKASHTVAKAAREAAMRNCYLKVSWTPELGCRVVAVQREPTL